MQPNLPGDVVHVVQAVCAISVSVGLQVVGDVMWFRYGLKSLLDCLECSLFLTGL